MQTIEELSIAIEEHMENTNEGLNMLRILNERYPARNLMAEFDEAAREAEDEAEMERLEALHFEEWWHNVANWHGPGHIIEPEDYDSGIEEENFPMTPPNSPER